VRFADEFHDPALAWKLANRIKTASTRPARLMEFCGGHTHAILRYGIRDLLPTTVTMSSGSGCPVCVTSPHDVDVAISAALTPGAIVATYGDLIRVAGSRDSLERARARGAEVRVVYSALDALAIAAQYPGNQVILLGIGFETTAPTVAASIIEARRRGLKNYRILSLLKLTPPIMRALLASGETRIDGIVCPGHVSVVIGTRPYDFIAQEFGVGCAVSGFEPLDILRAVDVLVQQIESGVPAVANAYSRAVSREGNVTARKLIEDVFMPCDADWRGIGVVTGSGLALRPEFAAFDASAILDLTTEGAGEPAGCRCGDVLRGCLTPPECALYGIGCTPEHPVGPCMVSQEGACAAHYAYGAGS